MTTSDQVASTSGASAARNAADLASAGVQQLTLSPARIIHLLLWITGALVVINVMTQLATLASPNFTGRDWLNITFGLGGEANLPATFSGGLLLFAALLLGAVALAKRRLAAPFALHWGLLSGVFLFLALDELASIHDNISAPLSRLHAPSGALLYLWVVPYGLAALALLLGSARFLFHLPAPTRRLFILSGAVYVGGALGIELLQAASNSVGNTTGFIALWSVIIEETMEMLGIVLFIYTLLSYIQKNLPGFALQLSVAPSSGQDRGT